MQIKLTKCQFAIVDENDYDALCFYKWRACFNPTSGRYYAKSSNDVYMHRLIMQCPDNMQIDHVNRNTLDNRRENLRIVTSSQNNINRGKKSSNTSGYKGVTFCKTTNMWRSQITFEGKTIFLGRFDTKEEAYAAYKIAAIVYHKEFSNV
jgi:hypothetical protein